MLEGKDDFLFHKDGFLLPAKVTGNRSPRPIKDVTELFPAIAPCQRRPDGVF